MAGFVGAVVQVTLTQPPGTTVQARVKEVIPGEALHLEDVYFPQSNQHWPFWVVQNGLIADLDIIKTSASLATAQLPIRDVPEPALTQQQRPSDQQPVDPAILSYERTPVRGTSTAASRTNSSRPLVSSSLPAQPQESAITPIDLRKVFESTESKGGTVKRSTRQPRQKTIDKQDSVPVAHPVIIDTEVSRNGNDMSETIRRGKGWRQTPLLQPAQTEAGQSKNKRRQQRQVDGEAQNGWATEEATDVQDMGEFDFEANLKLFDKEQVFEQLRKDDTTADEDRLVSHNKLPPRKNLLPTEMVLSPKLQAQGSDTDIEVHRHTGRSSSRQSVSKRQASRTNSNALLDSRPHPLTTSLSSDRAASRSVTSRKSRPLPVAVVGGLKNNSDRAPLSGASHKSQRKHQSAPADVQFVLGTGGTPCPVLLPPALQVLEEETVARYGITADAVTELAARSIVDETIRLINDPGEIRRPSRSNTARGGLTASLNLSDSTDQPVVVVLVGNHSTGARALAAVRHLVSRKYKVIVAEGDFHAAAPQDPQYTLQHQALKKTVRAGASIKRGAWRKANNYIKNLPGPPVAIIDALFAGSTYDDLLADPEGLSPTALEDSRQMIDWANRSRAPVISITCPSGVSGFDGSAAIVDGEPLAIRPDKLLALAMPVAGVLEAVRGGERWEISVADIGINIALKDEDAVEFGDQWVLPILLDDMAL